MTNIFNQELAIKNILNHLDAQHSLRVARYAVNFAKIVELSDSDTYQLEMSAIWHDVGKAEISSEILNKKEKLTDIEFKIIQKHPIYSEKYVLKYEILSKCGAIVRSHHERWDGKGYPDGIKGDGIPYLARILSIVDVYDALTSDRPYRERNFNKDEALEIIMAGSNTQFDPYLVLIFTNYFDQITDCQNSYVHIDKRKNALGGMRI